MSYRVARFITRFPELPPETVPRGRPALFLLQSATADSGAFDLIFSATDLVNASECEYRLLRTLDEKLGRTPKAMFATDPMRQRAGELGDLHELTVLASLVAKYGTSDGAAPGGVYRLDRGPTTRDALLARHAETENALRSGADVVFQATFFDGEFLGYADFLVNENAGTGKPGRYQVWDTKLARHAKVGALLQLAAYGDQLESMNLQPSPHATLVLGTQVAGDWLRSVHSLPDLLPVFRDRRRRFRDLTRSHRAVGQPVPWQQPGVMHCGRCDYCAEQVQLHRDLLMVAGMSTAQRHTLHLRGITRVDQLAALEPAQATGSVARLRAQARMQLHLDAPDGSRTFSRDGADHTVSFKVLTGQTIGTLPAPSPGDIFFDFEGDPLWQDPEDGTWGIEYLFGVVENPLPGQADTPSFRPFWAHSRAQEKRAFLAFLAYVEGRRKTYPDLHVYHYAAYEKSALRNLSLRHQAGEATVDDWLRSGLLVDLYATVRQSLRISEASYSIKKLEPLYMADNLRAGDVTDAGASVVAYAQYCALLEAAKDAQAAAVLASISDYNEYDCLSTLRLRDWLLTIAPASDAAGSHDAYLEPEEEVLDGTPQEARLQEFLADLPEDRPATDDERAIAMVAAATGYHRRERKQFWWQHFDRVEAPLETWEDQRNVFVVTAATTVSDWAVATPRARMRTRITSLRGIMTEGSDFRAGSTWCRLFDAPAPDGMRDPAAGPRSNATGRGFSFGTTIKAVEPDPEHPEQTIITIAEKETAKVPAYPNAPMALTEDEPLRTASIEAALTALATDVAEALPALPAHPGLAILRRQRPAFRTLSAPVPVPTPERQGALGDGDLDAGPDYVSAMTESLLELENSYLAVQGPPGTGKTFVGAHVVARLVAAGWKIGVVAQSHSVVENFLRRAIDTGGVDSAVVAKKVVSKTADAPDVPWRLKADGDVGSILARPGGCLVGGTAWTMTGKEVPAGSLDLLVIDEAGQFSLANTLSVSQAASRLLLLGDPQQLPQVTQGTHPEPVDESALGWLIDRHRTLPRELGYFLADSWRMHPVLCGAVSRLSYEGRLHSAAAASTRSLETLPPGVETVFVNHTGQTVSSAEEAAEVVNQVRRHCGLRWSAGDGQDSRDLVEEDILVVAAYNAQVAMIRTFLDRAGLHGVRVGTVDKFQGQEAPVVLVSMACSAIAEAPRGAEFLLNRNRINVAVSRGQWRAVIVRAPELTSFLPTWPKALEELGAFLGLSPRAE